MDEIVKFQKDRGLHKQEYDYVNECTNIVEELLEIGGLTVPKENRKRLSKLWQEFIDTAKINDIAFDDKDFDPEQSPIDGFEDIKVFCSGGQMKKGYDPRKTIVECGKEINSRVGSMVDGKFEKDLSDEAKDNWYKADYSKCKLQD